MPCGPVYEGPEICRCAASFPSPPSICAKSRTRRSNGWRGGSRLGYWLYFIPGAILVGAIIFYPLLRNLRLSFFHWRGGRAEEEFAGLDNYTSALTSGVSSLM